MLKFILLGIATAQFVPRQLNWFTAVDYDQYTHVRHLSDVDGTTLDDYFKVFEDGETKYYRLDEGFVPPGTDTPSRSMTDEIIIVEEAPAVQEEIIVVPQPAHTVSAPPPPPPPHITTIPQPST